MRGYGTSHKMKINLASSEQLKEAVAEFKNVTNITEVLERFMSDLIREGEERAKMICPKDTGMLEAGITSTLKMSKYTVTGSVICESDHAAYVEFGTGVVGENSPYPGDMGSYKRNVPSEKKDETGGWTYMADDGTFHYTHGHAPNPFMYQTAQYMKMVAPDIAKRIMSNDKQE